MIVSSILKRLFVPSLLVLHILVLCSAALTGCWSVPLSRSYDDPYNTPLPNETAPPSIQGTPSETCTRNPLSCGPHNTLTNACAKDKDCKEDETCYKGTCMIVEDLDK